jgi:hypothetical protein
MQRLRFAEALVFALLLSDCAPQPVYRQAEATELDGGSDDDAGSPDVAPTDTRAPDEPPADRPVTPDQGRSDQPPPADRTVTPDQGTPPEDDAAPPPASKDALLVVANPAMLAADDAKIKARLEAKGFVVTIADDDGDPMLADGMELVVVSGSVASATLGTKYQLTPVPVICLEPFVFGNLKMTGATRDTDFGQAMGTQIAVTLDTHPIAAGHARGNVTVASASTSLGWGLAPPTADRIATLVGMANRDTAFAYDTGKMMSGLIAPGRRVGLFPASPTPDRLNMAGWLILDASIDWATRP